MNTKELVKAIQPQIEEITGVKLNLDQTRSVLDVVTGTIQEQLKNGDNVDLTGFGKFEVVERKERNGINPSTLEKIVIPASKAPKFKPAKALKDLVKG